MSIGFLESSIEKRGNKNELNPKISKVLKNVYHLLKSKMINREEAVILLKKYLRDQHNIRFAIAVEAVLKTTEKVRQGTVGNQSLEKVIKFLETLKQ